MYVLALYNTNHELSGNVSLSGKICGPENKQSKPNTELCIINVN